MPGLIVLVSLVCPSFQPLCKKFHKMINVVFGSPLDLSVRDWVPDCRKANTVSSFVDTCNFLELRGL